MIHIFSLMCGKMHMSKSCAGRIMFLSEIVLWFVIGGLAGGLIGMMTGHDSVQMAVSVGSCTSFLGGFCMTSFRFLRADV